MRYIYNIRGVNLKRGNCFEDINFTNKKVALDSLTRLGKHWSRKLDLRTDKIIKKGKKGTTNDEQFIVEVDSEIRLTFTRKPIYTQVVEYQFGNYNTELNI
jgi:hypothetical protein